MIVGNQGISKGWADTYVWKLGGQYFVLDGGDGTGGVAGAIERCCRRNGIPAVIIIILLIIVIILLLLRLR
jgi:hypothetical protein